MTAGSACLVLSFLVLSFRILEMGFADKLRLWRAVASHADSRARHNTAQHHSFCIRALLSLHPRASSRKIPQ